MCWYFITFLIGICCNKHFVKFVLFHQAAYFFDCPLKAWYVLSVTPDEVLSAQVDPKIWTTFSWAQLGLRRKWKNSRTLQKLYIHNVKLGNQGLKFAFTFIIYQSRQSMKPQNQEIDSNHAHIHIKLFTSINDTITTHNITEWSRGGLWKFAA